MSGDARYVELAKKVRAIAEREAAEIEARWPKVLRRVQGYNLDFVKPEASGTSRSSWSFRGHARVFQADPSEALALPGFRALGVCHFRTFRQSMEAPQHHRRSRAEPRWSWWTGR